MGWGLEQQSAEGVPTLVREECSSADQCSSYAAAYYRRQGDSAGQSEAF